MKNTFSILILYLITSGLTCGYGQTKLTFTAKYEGSYYPLDSIVIENINSGSKIVRHYPDTILNLLVTRTDNIDYPGDEAFQLFQNYPNPFSGKTDFEIYIAHGDHVSINIYNISGRLILNFERNLDAGNHHFGFTGSGEKFYIVSARSGKYSASIKMINAGTINSSKPELAYMDYDPGFAGQKVFKKDPSKSIVDEFVYNTGDSIKFTGFITRSVKVILSDTITDQPADNQTYTFQFKKINRIAILIYHDLVDNVPQNEYERNLADFENDLIYLRNNYQVLSMEDLILIKSGNLKLNTDGVIITFDDGYGSVYTKAFPVLSYYNMPATFFLVAEWVETQNYMTWADVWLMSEYLNSDNKNIFTMGSHTSSHPYLEQSDQYFGTHQEYLDFLNIELGDSKIWITDITGQTDIFLALPFGDGAYNEDIIQTARNNGYKGIRTSIWNSFTVDEMNLFALPGIPILSESAIRGIEDYFDR